MAWAAGSELASFELTLRMVRPGGDGGVAAEMPFCVS